MTTTTATALESLPAAWSTADDTFFRVVSALFPPEFTAGAGVLLASYDEEPEATPAAAAPAAERGDRAARRVPVRS